MAIELDKRLFPVLEETLADCSNVELVEGDVLKLDLNRLIEERLGGGTGLRLRELTLLHHFL